MATAQSQDISYKRTKDPLSIPDSLFVTRELKKNYPIDSVSTIRWEKMDTATVLLKVRDTSLVRRTDPGLIPPSTVPDSIRRFQQLDESRFGKGLLQDNALQEALQIPGSGVPPAGSTSDSLVQQLGFASKRILSIQDRDYLDSIRGQLTQRVADVREKYGDSLKAVAFSEKLKMKDRMFYEVIFSGEQAQRQFSVSEVSTSLGMKLTDKFALGAGPELFFDRRNIQSVGARIFARRDLISDRFFALLENSSATAYRDLEQEGRPGWMNNWGIGAGTMINVLGKSKTRLNFQTLLNPMYLSNPDLNLLKVRLGISKTN